MPENPRIEELRRRVQKDPASIAFAQLAEEYRRAGQFAEAVEVARAGLEAHPTYLSARVTLGRALIELERYDEARAELEFVLRSAPENLAAIRGLAEIHQRRGELDDALRQYQAALGIAKHDPDLQESVHELSRQVAPDHAAAAPLVVPPPLPDVPAIDQSMTVADVPTFVPDLPRIDEVVASEPEPPVEPAPAMPGPSAGLDAAAEEFSKALLQLDDSPIDLPPLALDRLDEPAFAPSLDPPAPSEWTLERFDDVRTAASPDALAIDVEPVASGSLEAPSHAPSPDPEVEELEAWLDAIVLDRESNAAKRS